MVKVPEPLDDGNGVMTSLFNLVIPSVTGFMVCAFAILQRYMIALWPGHDESWKMIVARMLWTPMLQFLISLAEFRAFVLCIIYGSNGQHGRLTYRPPKKMGAKGDTSTQVAQEAVESPNEPQPVEVVKVWL